MLYYRNNDLVSEDQRHRPEQVQLAYGGLSRSHLHSRPDCVIPVLEILKLTADRARRPGPIPSESVQAPNFKHGDRSTSRRSDHHTVCLPNQPDVLEVHRSRATGGNRGAPRAKANGD